MKLNIKHQKEEPLLSRVKIEAELDFDKAAPSRKEIIEKIAQTLSVEPDLVVATKIMVIFRTHKAKVSAYAYKTKEERNRIEEKKILVRTGFNIPKLVKNPVAA